MDLASAAYRGAVLNGWDTSLLYINDFVILNLISYLFLIFKRRSDILMTSMSITINGLSFWKHNSSCSEWLQKRDIQILFKFIFGYMVYLLIHISWWNLILVTSIIKTINTFCFSQYKRRISEWLKCLDSSILNWKY